jgi:hypothetical protein
MGGTNMAELKPNYTQIPNIFFDTIAPDLSEAELKVFLYIARRTFGFHKEYDAISISQIANGIVRRDGTRIDKGAGVSRRSAIVGVQKLEALKILIVVRGTDEIGNTDTNYYALKLEGFTPPSAEFAPPPSAEFAPPPSAEFAPPPSAEFAPPPSAEFAPPLVQNLHPQKKALEKKVTKESISIVAAANKVASAYSDDIQVDVSEDTHTSQEIQRPRAILPEGSLLDIPTETLDKATPEEGIARFLAQFPHHKDELDKIDKRRGQSVARSPNILKWLKAKDIIQEEKTRTPPIPGFDEWFDECFWAQYPNKSGKQVSYGKLKAYVTSQSRADEVMAGLERYLNSEDWNNSGLNKPSASTWCREERWQDEPTPCNGVGDWLEDS